jgi:hypothetical protein
VDCSASDPLRELFPSDGHVPALLTLGEVSTLFHEFGPSPSHARPRKVASLNGANVVWDFAELLRESRSLCEALKTGDFVPGRG